MGISKPITRPVAVPVTGTLTRRAEESVPHSNGIQGSVLHLTDCSGNIYRDNNNLQYSAS